MGESFLSGRRTLLKVALILGEGHVPRKGNRLRFLYNAAMDRWRHVSVVTPQDGNHEESSFLFNTPVRTGKMLCAENQSNAWKSLVVLRDLVLHLGP